MRKTLLSLIIILLIISLCGCKSPLFVRKPDSTQSPSQTLMQTSVSTPIPTPTPAPTPSPTQVATPTATHMPTAPPEPSPTPTPVPTPTPEKPLPIFYITTPDDLVIIADDEGVILYGYAHGEWITHTKTTRYYKDDMVFYQYNIEGLVRTLETVGIAEAYVWYEASGLKFDDKGDYGAHYAMEFENDPEIIYGTIITNVAPGMLPDAVNIEVSSKLKSRVQLYLDFSFGADAPKANIISATSIDLTGDGENEILVNANNYTHNVDAIGRPWYSIMFIIDSDNTVYVLQEDAFLGEYEEDEYELNYGSFYLVSDIDGDGTCEIIFDEYGYECYGIYVYTYNGYYEHLVLHTGACS